MENEQSEWKVHICKHSYFTSLTYKFATFCKTPGSCIMKWCISIHSYQAYISIIGRNKLQDLGKQIQLPLPRDRQTLLPTTPLEQNLFLFSLQ